ncbi:hypothetical protein D3C76_1502540 [compost metagenome]
MGFADKAGGLRVVHIHRPEVAGRSIGRDCQPVGVVAIEARALIGCVALHVHMRARRYDRCVHGEPGIGAFVEIQALAGFDEAQLRAVRRGLGSQRAPLALVAPDRIAGRGVAFHQVDMGFISRGLEQLLALGIWRVT